MTLWSFSQTDGKYTSVDLRDATEVGAVMRTCAPNAVIHSAACRDPDYCERHPDEARALNVDGTRNVVAAADARSARVGCFSTGCVVYGESPPYGEDTPIDPLNVYGQSKAEAEEVVRRAESHLIVRIPILYGRGAKPGTDLLEKFRQAVEAGADVVADNEAQRSPTLTDDVADAIAFLLARDLCGTFHVSNKEVLTRYGMMGIVARVLGRSMDPIKPGPSRIQAARRPRAALIDTTKLRRAGFDSFTSFEDGVRQLLGQ